MVDVERKRARVEPLVLVPLPSQKKVCPLFEHIGAKVTMYLYFILFTFYEERALRRMSL